MAVILLENPCLSLVLVGRLSVGRELSPDSPPSLVQEVLCDAR